MRRKYFIKEAVTSGGERLWIRVPGTPFTLPGAATQYERLPGMTEWVPRDDVETVSKAMEHDVPIDQISEQVSRSGLWPGMWKGLGVGGVAGALAGRAVGGEAAFSPFIDIKDKGLTSKTLAGLKKVPGAMKALPWVGAALGGAHAYGKWKSDYEGRGDRAKDIAKGLLAERILQTSAIRDAEDKLLNDGMYY
jgi:hypothetical protein